MPEDDDEENESEATRDFGLLESIRSTSHLDDEGEIYNSPKTHIPRSLSTSDSLRLSEQAGLVGSFSTLDGIGFSGERSPVGLSLSEQIGLSPPEEIDFPDGVGPSELLSTTTSLSPSEQVRSTAGLSLSDSASVTQFQNTHPLNNATSTENIVQDNTLSSDIEQYRYWVQVRFAFQRTYDALQVAGDHVDDRLLLYIVSGVLSSLPRFLPRTEAVVAAVMGNILAIEYYRRSHD